MTSLSQLMPRLGALSWASAEVFALEGRWAEEMTSAPAVVHLATHSRHHGWHAGLWAEALPDSPALEARSSIVAPPGWSRALAAIDTLAVESDVHRLTVLYRGLVPRLAALVDDLGTLLDGPGDAAISRVHRLVSADVSADLTGGGGLLATALEDANGPEIAATVTMALDQAFRIN